VRKPVDQNSNQHRGHEHWLGDQSPSLDALLSAYQHRIHLIASLVECYFDRWRHCVYQISAWKVVVVGRPSHLPVVVEEERPNRLFEAELGDVQMKGDWHLIEILAIRIEPIVCWCLIDWTKDRVIENRSTVGEGVDLRHHFEKMADHRNCCSHQTKMMVYCQNQDRMGEVYWEETFAIDFDQSSRQPMDLMISQNSLYRTSFMLHTR
jgi:hypothetical protein